MLTIPDLVFQVLIQTCSLRACRQLRHLPVKPRRNGVGVGDCCIRLTTVVKMPLIFNELFIYSTFIPAKKHPIYILTLEADDFLVKTMYPVLFARGSTDPPTQSPGTATTRKPSGHVDTGSSDSESLAILMTRGAMVPAALNVKVSLIRRPLHINESSVSSVVKTERVALSLCFTAEEETLFHSF